MIGIIAAVIDRANALVIQAILTYILLKEDFGIWSLASPIMALTTILFQTAIRDILVNRAPKFHLWCNPTIWFSIVLGLIAGLGTVILGFIASIAYDSPKITLVLAIAALQPISSSVTTVPRAKLSIDMRFGTISTYFCIKSISNWVFALIFAIFGAGAYAFPLGIGVTAIAQTIAIWIIAPVPIKRNPQLRRWKYFVTDTGTIIASNFARWTRTQGDRLVLGFFLTQSMMGVYFLAFQLSLQTFSVTTLNLSSILLPTLASLNDQPERQIKAFIRSLRMLLFFAAPICAGTIVVATPTVNLLFDEQKWNHLDTTLQLITAGMIFRAIEPPVISLINAKGKFHQLFLLNIISVVSFVSVVLLFLFAANGVDIEAAHLYAAAIAGVVFHILWAILLIRVAVKDTIVSTSQAVITLSQPILYAALAGASAWLAMMFIPTSLNDLNPYAFDTTKIATAVIAFLIAYSIIARIHKPEEFDTLAAFVIRMTPGKLKPLNTKLAAILFGCKPENAEQ